MYGLEDLFDKRSIVGARLEQILAEKKCTKAELYKNTHVSRPTIDKILEGTITSKKNYETHMQKIINYLHITPDILLGNTSCGKNRVRELRSVIKISTEKMAEATGISAERLQQIEAGEDATLAELRDIAVMLSTSTNVLTQKYFFEPQIGEMEWYIDVNSATSRVSGFWGHVGILLNGFEKYMWFPITCNTRKMIIQKRNNEFLVIPCMNNKVLFLNMPNIQEITLCDFDTDEPVERDWDDEVDCGDLPLVVYEALEEVVFDEAEDNDDKLSPKLRKFIDEYIEKKGWMEEDVLRLLNDSTIYYSNGKKRQVWIDFENDDISEEIEMIYGYEIADLEETFLYYVDQHDETENLLNMNKVSMIELPLLKVEDAIYRRDNNES